MKNLSALASVVSIFAASAYAQPRPTNWAGFGADPQRSGWERTDPRISKDTVKDLQLLWKLKLEKDPRGARPLLPPMVLGNLISYKGFKELAFVAANSDVIYGVDADFGRVFWTKHLEYASLDAQTPVGSGVCSEGLTAMPVMPVPAPRAAPPAGRGPAPAAAVPTTAPATTAGRGRGGAPATPAAAGRGRGGRGGTAPAATAAAPPPPPPPARGPFAATGTGSFYVISSDGRLHRINTSTGDDYTQPIKVLPSNSVAFHLNVTDNALYVVTAHNCDDAPDAVWAVDLTADPLKLASFPLTGGDAGPGGAAIGSDGTVYVQTADRVLALSAKELHLKHSFDLPGNETAAPMVISQDNHDLIVAAAKDRVYGLDSTSLEPVAQSASVGLNINGSLASWQDAGGARWILAPTKSSIAAFKLEDRDGTPTLTAAWTSPGIDSPLPPVIASGVVFALSPGGSHATLHALDAETGKELYTSGTMVPTPASPTGISVANGRVYFGTTDGTLYCFGMFMER